MTVNRNIWKGYLPAALISGAVILFLCIKGRLFYEEGTDTYFKIIVSGMFMDSPQPLINLGIHNFISDIYASLYTTDVHTPWYDLGSMLFLWLGLLLHVRLAFVLGRKWLSAFPVAGITVIVLLGFLLAEQVMLVQLTRISFLLASGSILLLARDKISDGLTGPRTAECIFLYICLALSLLVRIEPPVILLGVTGLFMLYAKMEGLLFYFKRFGLALIMVLALGFWLRAPHIPADEQYNIIRPYTYTLWDYDYVDAPNELTEKERMVYRSAMMHFIADTAVFTPEQFEAMGIYPVDKSPQYWPKYLKGALKKLADPGRLFAFAFHGPDSLWYGVSVGFYLLLLILLMACGGRIHFMQHLIFWLLIMAIVVFMKMEYRVFQPLLLFFILWLLLQSTGDSLRVRSAWLYITFIAMLAFAGMHTKLMRVRHQTIHAHQTEVYEVLNEVATKFPEATPVLALGIMEKMQMQLCKAPVYNELERYLSMDNALLFFYGAHQSKMSNATGSGTVEGQMRGMASEQFIFVTITRRMELLEDYMRVMYNVHLKRHDLTGEIGALNRPNVNIPDMKVVYYTIEP